MAPILGLIGARDHDLPPRFRETQLRMFGMRQQVVVLAVVPDSSAARAEIARGDQLLAISKATGSVAIPTSQMRSAMETRPPLA